MLDTGYVKIDRSILKWRWYKNPNTFKLFMHLLLNANYEDKEFEQHTIKRGQIVTGRKKLSVDTGLTEREVRTAINHLKTTNEVTIKSTSKYTIITINNYEDFQGATSTFDNKRPASDQQATSNRPQLKKDKKDNKAINDKRNASYSIEMFESKSLFKD